MKRVYKIVLLLYICFMKTHTIYTLVNPITNTPFYVGETTNLKNRISKHLGCKEKGKSEKNVLIKSILDVGLKPTIKILDYNIETKEEAEKIESFWIADYFSKGFPLTNKNMGGNKPPSQKGKKFEEEWKIKHRESSPLLRKVYQLTKSGEYVNCFFGVREACRKTGIDHRSIAQVAGGSKIRKSAGGYLWKYNI